MPASEGTFVLARNPDEDSSLPYLLRLPLDGGIALKARERWPVTARVYCHPLDDWPQDVDVLEEVPVRRCERRGRAVDLVLDRARENRSQFVITEPSRGRSGGRTMIFWQTARTARRARRGQRAPVHRRSRLGRFTIEVDTRERYPYRFAGRPVDCERQALPPATTPSERVTACSVRSSARRSRTSRRHSPTARSGTCSRTSRHCLRPPWWSRSVTRPC